MSSEKRMKKTSKKKAGKKGNNAIWHYSCRNRRCMVDCGSGI